VLDKTYFQRIFINIQIFFNVFEKKYPMLITKLYLSTKKNKQKKKRQYCEILLQFKMTVFYLNVFKKCIGKASLHPS